MILYEVGMDLTCFNWIQIIKKTDLPSNAKLVCFYLSTFMNAEHDIAWPSQSRIAAETGLSKPTVNKWLQYLDKTGWLVTKKKFRAVSSGNQNYHHNEYMVSIPKHRLNELTAGHSTGKTVEEQRLNESGAEVKPFNTNNNINNNSNNNKENIPVWLDKELWKSFVDHRKQLKAPMTGRAKSLLITKLEKYHLSGQDIEAIINQSIMNGWKSVFEEKGNDRTNGTHRQDSRASRVNSEIDRLAIIAAKKEGIIT